MPELTWLRARKPGFSQKLPDDQIQRFGVVVGLYKALEILFSQPLSRNWIKLANRGPEFEGQPPIDVMIAGGMPAIIRVRRYVEALLCGM